MRKKQYFSLKNSKIILTYFEIKSHNFSFEINDLTSQTDYEEQFKKQEKIPMTFFHYHNKYNIPFGGAYKNISDSKKKDLVTETNEKTIYYIKIPIINPRNEANLQQYSMKLNFFFKSLKPQEYWTKKGTSIYLDFMF